MIWGQKSRFPTFDLCPLNPVHLVKGEVTDTEYGITYEEEDRKSPNKGNSSIPYAQIFPNKPAEAASEP